MYSATSLVTTAFYLGFLLLLLLTPPKSPKGDLFTYIMSKRRRVSVSGRTSKRPIDKSLVFILLNDVNATQQTAALSVGKTPCTIQGIRWSMLIEGDAGTVGNDHDYAWAIILVRDGFTANTIANTANLAALYEPEQDVVAFGVGTSHSSSSATTGTVDANWAGKTKSMRKLKVGDVMQFAIRGIATETVRVRGCIQLFCQG